MRWVILAALLVCAPGLRVLLDSRSEARTTSDAATPTPSAAKDSLADLLAWIPATPLTRSAFAAWSPPADPSRIPDALPGNDRFIERLALSPVPRTLGRSPGWRERFSYGARDVLGWAAAGPSAELTVLVGQFDREAIERALREGGYRQTSHQGQTVFVLHDFATPTPIIEGDSLAAANAIAVLPDRLITSAVPALVEQAIDAGIGRIPSLAEDPIGASLLATLAPINGLMVLDAATHAAACGFETLESEGDEENNRYVAVAYGWLGEGGPRRTLLVNALASDPETSAAMAAYEAAWLTSVVSVGGSPLDAFGRLDAVSRSGRLLIAEIGAGRDDGWVRSGIRFAAPVCAAATIGLSGAPLTASR